jgi:hypothetical protein
MNQCQRVTFGSGKVRHRYDLVLLNETLFEERGLLKEVRACAVLCADWLDGWLAVKLFCGGSHTSFINHAAQHCTV